MKLVMNKILSFLRGLIKFSKVQHTPTVRVSNDTEQYYRYGEALVFNKKYPGEGGRFVIDCYMSEEQYERFKDCYDESPFLESIVEQNAPTVHARQIDVSKPHRTACILQGKIETTRLRLDGSELYGPSHDDPRCVFSLNILVSHPILNHTSITLYPLLDSEGKLVCLDFLGVDNTDLNELLMRAMIAGKTGAGVDLAGLISLAGSSFVDIPDHWQSSSANQLQNFVAADEETYNRVLTTWSEQNPISKDVK